MNTFMDALTKNEKSYTAMMELHIVRVAVNWWILIFLCLHCAKLQLILW